jgi:FkbM family methyltransferase
MNVVFNNAKLCKKIKGFVQVGASIGEEIPEWSKLQVPNQIYIEPIVDLFGILQYHASRQPHNPNVKCYNIAVSDHDGVDDFHISTGSFCSSSLLDFREDAVKLGQTLQNAEIRKVTVKKIDTLVEEEKIDLNLYNMLYLDAQGCEYSIIKGAEKSISKFDFIFTEVNLIPIYKDVVLFPDLDKYVKSLGFKKVDVRIIEGSNGTQGEALYFRKDLVWN